MAVTIGDREHELPDFIVDPGDYRLSRDSPCISRPRIARRVPWLRAAKVESRFSIRITFVAKPLG